MTTQPSPKHSPADTAALPSVAADPLAPPELAAFVLHEARLLDERRWAEWAALFAPDGWYWLPAAPEHTDPLNQASHLYDDALLREVRIARLQSPQAHSQQPPGRCHHLLQAPTLLPADAAHTGPQLRTPFIYTELRAARTIILSGVAWHHLVPSPEGWRIALKRVDLLHADQPLPAVEFYI
jgi:3-phenylpropionate/cinnamic acid dioxygenase small subunit